MDQAVANYLLDGSLPPEGTVCDQDLTPFVDFGASTSQSGTALMRAGLVPGLVPEAVHRGVPQGR
jgi:hypothetical protein